MTVPTSYSSLSRLSLEQAARYWQDGYLICRQVVSAEQCDEMIAHGHGIAEAQGGLLHPIMQPHRLDTYFGGILAHPAVVRIIADLLGEIPDGLQTLFYFSPPGRPGFILHQDNYCVEAKDNDFLSAWIALGDVTPENGCLKVYPGSHTKGVFPVRPLSRSEINADFPNMSDAPLFDAAIMPMDVPLKKGDLVVLHGNVVHFSNPNKSIANRYAHLNTYIRPGTTFRAGFTAQREAEPLRFEHSMLNKALL